MCLYIYIRSMQHCDIKHDKNNRCEDNRKKKLKSKQTDNDSMNESEFEKRYCKHKDGSDSEDSGSNSNSEDSGSNSNATCTDNSDTVESVPKRHNKHKEKIIESSSCDLDTSETELVPEKFEERAKCMDEREKKMEKREKKMEKREKSMEEREEKIEKREAKLELYQELREDCAEKREKWETRLEEREESLESRERKMEEREKKMEYREERIESRDARREYREAKRTQSLQGSHGVNEKDFTNISSNKSVFAPNSPKTCSLIAKSLENENNNTSDTNDTKHETNKRNNIKEKRRKPSLGRNRHEPSVKRQEPSVKRQEHPHEFLLTPQEPLSIEPLESFAELNLNDRSRKPFIRELAAKRKSLIKESIRNNESEISIGGYDDPFMSKNILNNDSYSSKQPFDKKTIEDLRTLDKELNQNARGALVQSSTLGPARAAQGYLNKKNILNESESIPSKSILDLKLKSKKIFKKERKHHKYNSDIGEHSDELTGDGLNGINSVTDSDVSNKKMHEMDSDTLHQGTHGIDSDDRGLLAIDDESDNSHEHSGVEKYVGRREQNIPRVFYNNEKHGSSSKLQLENFFTNKSEEPALPSMSNMELIKNGRDTNPSSRNSKQLVSHQLRRHSKEPRRHSKELRHSNGGSHPSVKLFENSESQGTPLINNKLFSDEYGSNTEPFLNSSAGLRNTEPRESRHDRFRSDKPRESRYSRSSSANPKYRESHRRSRSHDRFDSISIDSRSENIDEARRGDFFGILNGISAWADNRVTKIEYIPLVGSPIIWSTVMSSLTPSAPTLLNNWNEQKPATGLFVPFALYKGDKFEFTYYNNINSSNAIACVAHVYAKLYKTYRPALGPQHHQMTLTPKRAGSVIVDPMYLPITDAASRNIADTLNYISVAPNVFGELTVIWTVT
jgi:hypothetical protein